MTSRGTRSPHSRYDVILIVTSFATQWCFILHLSTTAFLIHVSYARLSTNMSQISHTESTKYCTRKFPMLKSIIPGNSSGSERTQWVAGFVHSDQTWQKYQTVCRRRTAAGGDQQHDHVHHCRPTYKPRPATDTAEETSAAVSHWLQTHINNIWLQPPTCDLTADKWLQLPTRLQPLALKFKLWHTTVPPTVS